MAQRYQGKRAGSRKAPKTARPTKPARTPGKSRPVAILLWLGILIALAGWGYLVWRAISFGGDARNGDSMSWGYLALAALGACVCLFLGLMLLVRLSRTLGWTSGPPSKRPPDRLPPRRPNAGGPQGFGGGDRGQPRSPQRPAPNPQAAWGAPPENTRRFPPTQQQGRQR